MFVRTLTEADGDALWSLRLRALIDNPEAFATTYEETLIAGKERLVESLCQQEAFYLGAFNPGPKLDLIGVVYFRRDEGHKNRHKGRILGMYVRPESRGQGVGKVLLQEVITQTKQFVGVEQLHLMVVTSNTAARSLYRSLGFEVYGTMRRAMKMNEHYWDEEMMVRHLL
ncbi:MAG: GNAT family N-acetyltransferase [Ktedonobacteraceae bacterium]